MIKICKRFNNMDEASVFQDKLYGRYDVVRLVDFPRTSDSGMYVWEVR